MGKRRTASKAPRTPLSRRSDKDVEEFPVTPRQQLAMMGLCKEDLFMCSQSADSQIDVKWDCNSPEALQQIKRYRGQVLRNDMDDIVMNLANETDLPTTSEPLLGLWNSKDDHVQKQSKTISNNRVGRPDRKRRSRRPSGLASAQSADELLERLTMALHRQEDIAEEETSKPPSENHPRQSPEPGLPVAEEADHMTTLPTHCDTKLGYNASRDLFDSSEDPSKTRRSDKLSAMDSLVAGTLQTVAEEIVDEQWSDDDLFDNESLLMKASSVDVMCSPTPQPTSRLTKRKCQMNSPSEPENKPKRFAEACCASTPLTLNIKTEIAEETILAPKFLKTPFIESVQSASRVQTEYTNGKSICDEKALTTNAQSKQDKQATRGTVNSYVATSWNKNIGQGQQMTKLNHSFGKTSSVANSVIKGNDKRVNVCVSGQGETSSRESSKNDVIPSSQVFSSKTSVPSAAGRTFKRHNTFPSVSVSPRNTKILGKSAPSSHGQSVPQVKSENFKVNGTSVNKPNGYTFYKGVNAIKIPNFDPTKGNVPFVVKKEQSTTGGSGLPKPFDFLKSPVNKLRRRSSFDSSMLDTSLTDDILCQLAEPDEILDSQFDLGVTEPTKSVGCHGIQAKSGCITTSTNSVNKASDGTCENRKQNSSQVSSKTVQASVSIPQAAGQNNTTAIGSSVRNPLSDCQLAQSERSSQIGKYQFKSVPAKPGVRTKPSATIPNRTRQLPVHVGSKGKPVPSASTETVKTSARHSSTDTQPELDDSFFNDDELSNPEVLAMLDEVEIKATQATQGSKSPVFKCTPDEIEKKKKAAMERRKKNLQLQKKKPAPRPSSRHYKPLF